MALRLGVALISAAFLAGCGGDASTDVTPVPAPVKPQQQAARSGAAVQQGDGDQPGLPMSSVGAGQLYVPNQYVPPPRSTVAETRNLERNSRAPEAVAGSIMVVGDGAPRGAMEFYDPQPEAIADGEPDAFMEPPPAKRGRQ